jgi:NAD(P)-dependent dehydrogenase (short-subunit alcohol dehydrogenase family)
MQLEEETMTKGHVAVIAGTGPALGRALAERFAQGGYETVIASRNKTKLEDIARAIGDAGGGIHTIAADLTEPKAVKALFDEAGKFGPLAVTVFNAGNMHSGPILEIDPADFEKVWRVACYAGFLVGQEAARRMVPNKAGTLIFTGATASLRGGAQFVTFASAKAGLRSVAQSMARSLGKEGIHVAHVVIDGVIDTELHRKHRPDLYKRLADADCLMKPSEIAQVYYALHEQPKSAWSFEIDMRPAAETF